MGKWILGHSITFDAVFCSSSQRTRQTLELMLDKKDLINVKYSDELLELSQGAWEGIPRKLIYTEEQLNIINSDNYKFKSPKGESQEDVENRMYQFIESEILGKYTNGAFLVMTHGMAIKCLLRKILGSAPAMTYKLIVSNSSVTKLQYEKKQGWTLCYMNWLAHLER